MASSKNRDFGSQKTILQKKPEKSGLLKRVLYWIAKGAEQSHKGRTSCPN